MAKIKIYNPTTGSNEYRCENAIVKKTLNKADIVSCKIISESKITFLIGSYIDSITTANGAATRYKLNKQPVEKKIASTLFEYTLVFESPMYDLKKSTFQILGKTDTPFIGDATAYLDLIISSLATDGYTFTAGTVDATDDKELQFTGENCWAVLNRICNEFNLEFQFVGNEISLTYRVSNARPLVVLSQGFGNGIKTIDKIESNESNIVTRLYYEGSTKNLPASYGKKRLQGTTPYVSNNEALYGVYSAVKYYDDIFPTYTGTIGTVAYVNDGKTPTFVDLATPFDLNDYIIPGVLPQIKMLDGNCAGYVFEILRYRADSFRFTLKPQADAAGNQIPSAAGLNIATSDTFKVLNISLPTSYITAAVASLDAEAASDILDISNPPVDFDIVLDPKVINDLYDIAGGAEEVFDIGDKLNITDTDLSIPADQRITDIEYDLFYKAKCKIKISETRFDLVGRKEEIELYVNTKSAYVNSLYDPVQIQKTFRTSDDVWKQVFSSYDNYFDVDNRARKESFDPFALALDSGEIQFVKSAKINKVSSGSIAIGSGTFTIRNYNALRRYEIERLLDLALPYAPNQTWAIAGNSVSYTPGVLTYLYVKVDNTKDGSGNLIGTSAELVANTSVINNKYETTDFLYYLVGEIDSSENLTLINGGQYWNERTAQDDYVLRTKYATIQGLTTNTSEIGIQLESDLDVINDWKMVSTISAGVLNKLSFKYTDIEKVSIFTDGRVSGADALNVNEFVTLGQLNSTAITLTSDDTNILSLLGQDLTFVSGTIVKYGSASTNTIIGTDQGSYNIVNGSGNFNAKLGYTYCTVNGVQNAYIATGSVLYNSITGYRNAYTATSNVYYNSITGYQNAFSATVSVYRNSITGSQNAYNATGTVSYNSITGLQNAFSATGNITNSLLVGSNVAFSATGANHLIGVGESVFNGSIVDLSKSIGLGYHAGENTLYTNTALFGQLAQGTKNDQVVIGSTAYTEILLDNNTEVNGTIQATRLISTEPTLAPLTVTSVTEVTNLNANLWQGHLWSEIAALPISTFSNDVGYLTSAIAATTYVPLGGTLDQVFVSDGAGSGAWSDITASQWTTTSFGIYYNPGGSISGAVMINTASTGGSGGYGLYVVDKLNYFTSSKDGTGNSTIITHNTGTGNFGIESRIDSNPVYGPVAFYGRLLQGGLAFYAKFDTVVTNDTAFYVNQAGSNTAKILATGDAYFNSISVVSTTEVANLNAEAWGGFKPWTGTQAAYDLLTPDANTLYIIVG